MQVPAIEHIRWGPPRQKEILPEQREQVAEKKPCREVSRLDSHSDRPFAQPDRKHFTSAPAQAIVEAAMMA